MGILDNKLMPQSIAIGSLMDPLSPYKLIQHNTTQDPFKKTNGFFGGNSGLGSYDVEAASRNTGLIAAAKKNREAATRQVAEMLSNAGYLVTAGDITSLFSRGAVKDADSFNDFFKKFSVRLEASDKGFSAYFHGKISNPEEMLAALREMQNIAVVTGDSIGRMLMQDNITYVSREELAAYVKGLATAEAGTYPRLDQMKSQFMSLEMQGALSFNKNGEEYGNDYYFCLAMALIYNRRSGMLAYLFNKDTNMNGVNLNNPRVMKEFKAVFEAFISNDPNAPELGSKIKGLKDMSMHIAAAEKWLKDREGLVNHYMHIKKLADPSARLSLSLTPEDYANDALWDAYNGAIAEHCGNTIGTLSYDFKELYDIWTTKILPLKK